MKSHLSFPALVRRTAALLLTGTALHAAPVISEFLAANRGPETDDLGQTSDWIEIRNPGPGPVNLAGWSLTDDADTRAKWVFPSVTLEAGASLVVRASGLDRRDPLLPLHTNFSLAAGGEYLGLFSPADVPSTVWEKYPKQFPGISYGFGTDGTSQGYFTTPTPGADNTTALISGYVGDTRFSVDRGFFTAPFSLSITTDTQGAVIRYTTDGSPPGEDTGTLYTGPVTIGSTTVVRARAFRTGYLPSNVDTQSYIFAATWKSQPDTPPGVSHTWGQFDTNFKILGDYGMNTGVTNNATYGPLVIPALTQTLPVVCVTGNVADLFGDSGIQGNFRKTDTEVPVAVEYFNPNDTSDHFSTRATLQPHGGAVRDFAKKAFRIDFTGDLADGALHHPLFAGSPVEVFDQLVLRSGGHDSFTVRTRGGAPDQSDLAFHASYLRDQFLRRTEIVAGLVSPHGRYVHLCLNGLYWGLYDLHERPNAEMMSTHAGGDPAQWDVLHHASFRGGEPDIIDGSLAAWTDLQTLSNAPVTTPAAYQSLGSLVGLDRYVDHLLIRMWAGDHDWLGPAYLPSSTLGTTGNVAVYDYKNWYAARDSRAVAPGTWRFFTWDGEISMGNHLLYRFFDGLATPAGLDFPHLREMNLDFTGIAGANTPAAPWAAMAAYPEFRLKVADRARRLLFYNGALSPALASARIGAFIQELDLPMVAESARWGTVSGYGFRNVEGIPYFTWDNTLLTRDTHWRPEVAWLRDTFAAGRGDILLAQLRARGLYPATAPVEITPFGGVPEEDTITLTAPEGVVYYTLDGSDPRNPLSGSPSASALVYAEPFLPPAGGEAFTVKTRVLNAGVWSALTETTFSSGVSPAAGALAITEIHYHPAPPSPAELAAGFTDADDFEFLEITNISSGRVSLAGLRFAAGIDFDFSVDSATRELTPGVSLVLAANAAAFQLRYGFAPAGVFANGTGLSNSGERLKLVTAGGLTLAEVAYDDGGEWPVSADGGGYSLVLIAPASGTDPGDPGNWRASTEPGGNPGTVPGITYAAWLRDYFTAAEIADPLVTGPLANPDVDGMPNLTEYATRTNPRKASQNPVKISVLPDGTTRFSWECRADAPDVTGTLELSTDLKSWLPATAPGVTLTSANTTSGTVRQTAESTPATGFRFARLKVTLTQ